MRARQRWRGTRAWAAVACLAAASGCSWVPARADDAPPRHPRHTLGNTELRALPRSANGREYLLYVALPYSYGSEPGRRYPVLYICDGYWDFTLLNGFYGNLRYDRVIPELMIVGIGYQGDKPDYENLRRYDYTPVPDPADRWSDAAAVGARDALFGVSRPNAWMQV